MKDLTVPPSEIEIGNVINCLKRGWPEGVNVLRRLTFQRDGLLTALHGLSGSHTALLDACKHALACLTGDDPVSQSWEEAPYHFLWSAIAQAEKGRT